MRLRLFLKSENVPGKLFSVLEESGAPAYTVEGKAFPLGCRFMLRMPDGTAAAHLSGLCLQGVHHFTAVQGTRSVRMRVQPGSPHRPVQFRGEPWRFRGNLAARSFDVVAEYPGGAMQLILTHGRCWNGEADCYALTVTRAEDVPLAVCIAAVLDLSSQACCLAPVPAG
jgi:uncharacterized protein YxjI